MRKLVVGIRFIQELKKSSYVKIDLLGEVPRKNQFLSFSMHVSEKKIRLYFNPRTFCIQQIQSKMPI